MQVIWSTLIHNRWINSCFQSKRSYISFCPNPTMTCTKLRFWFFWVLFSLCLKDTLGKHVTLCLEQLKPLSHLPLFFLNPNSFPLHLDSESSCWTKGLGREKLNGVGGGIKLMKRRGLLEEGLVISSFSDSCFDLKQRRCGALKKNRQIMELKQSW